MTHTAARRIALVSHAKPHRDDHASRHFAARGFEIEWTVPALGGALPEPDERYAGAIVYGGEYPVCEIDRYSFLEDEMDWIGRWLARDKPFLGICLGGQLLAHHLGAEVGPHPEDLYEFGFHSLIPTPQGRAVFGEDLRVMQKHYHGFELPAGATSLARTAGYSNQAFSYGGSAFGFQFHPEMTAEILDRWHRRTDAPFDAKGAHSRARQEADFDRYNPATKAWFESFLDTLFGAPALVWTETGSEQAAEYGV